MMSNALKKARKSAANKLFKYPKGILKPIDLTNKPHPEWMTRAYQNNRYVVMINDNCPTDKGNAIRVMVQKHDDTPITNHWREMQDIKNELFGPETMAVEYYPKQSQLIDNNNIYWFWVFPDGILPTPL